MKQFKIVMVSIAVLAALICGWTPVARADDQQEISDLEHKLAVTTNVDELMKYWDSSDDVVIFDVMTPREFVGQKAIRNHFGDFSGYRDAKADFLELKIFRDGKLALASSVQHYTAKDADGKLIDDTFRQSDLWRRTNGQWKLIHSHASFPVDMKTGKADMASKM